MRFKTNLKTSTNLINLTPLVDVVFLMLIFFIVTSDILPLKSLNIENPKIAKDSSPMTTQLLVVMDAQHVIYVGSKKAIVDFDSLKSYLQDEILKLQKQYGNVNPTVVVSVDRLAEYGSFLRLFSIVQDCSQRLRLAYTPIEEPEE
ncbi:MAG TPA: biopolymer transporter ExbD [Parachlamydiaceae bacterium]|nr:biopolymer transporter ExbD [Parachlamydiaceae bacterium]